MRKVSVIIVNYNTKDILEDCIRNLDGQYKNMEVFVIDNDSPDGSAEMVKREFAQEDYPWLKLIEAPNNGLAASSNIGLEKTTGDYLLYMGSDAFPEKGTIEGMVDYMEEHKKVGVATCKLVQRDSKLDMDAHRGFPTPWVAISHFLWLDRMFPKSKVFNGYFMGYENLDEPHEIDLCISHFMLIKREVLLKLKMHKTSAKSMRIFYDKHWKNKYPAIVTKAVFAAIETISFYRVLRAKIEIIKGR